MPRSHIKRNELIFWRWEGSLAQPRLWRGWLSEHGIPLHKAQTCVNSFDIECGDCSTYWDRRREYKEAGVEDPTKYRFPMYEKYPIYYDHEDEEKNEKRNRS